MRDSLQQSGKIRLSAVFLDPKASVWNVFEVKNVRIHWCGDYFSDLDTCGARSQFIVRCARRKT